MMLSEEYRSRLCDICEDLRDIEDLGIVIQIAVAEGGGGLNCSEIATSIKILTAMIREQRKALGDIVYKKPAANTPEKESAA